MIINSNDNGDEQWSRAEYDKFAGQFFLAAESKKTEKNEPFLLSVGHHWISCWSQCGKFKLTSTVKIDVF